ncbi:MAG: signal recognition particle protein [Planctomycetes bacterium]|nr:signal recognition particle protein [Planctomycetota bacterium]
MFENLTGRFSEIVAGLRGKKLTERNIQETVRAIQVALLEADVALEVVRAFIKRVREKAVGLDVVEGVDAGQQFIKIVHDELVELMGPVDPEIPFRNKGVTVLLLAGLQGSGKTTTCGKLANYLRTKKDRRPMMVAADLQRPAAIEQLKVLGKQLDIPVFHEPDLSPPLLCEKAVQEAQSKGCDTVLLDTAGRLHIDEQLMGELKEVAQRTKPDQIFLVCDSMTGQDAVHSAREFNAALELTGLILTKLDGDARGGAALSVKHVTGKTIKFIGTGEKLDRLEPFHPDRMAGRILGMGDIVGIVERAQEKMDQKLQEEMERKIREASWDLDDFLQQIHQMKKMGPLRDLLGMLPGIGAKVDELGLQGDEMKVVESIIQSMTKEERRRPEILNTSRRQRIARGCGRTVDDVNELLKQFKMMKGIMDEMAGHGTGMFGKMKALNSMRKKIKSGQGMGQALAGVPGLDSSAGSMAALEGNGGMPMIPNMTGEPKRQASSKTKKDIQKQRKAERQRRRKQRKRR